MKKSENQKMFEAVCQRIKKLSTNPRDHTKGIKTTSYTYHYKDFVLYVWYTDAETTKLLFFKNKKIGKWYQCWDHPIEFAVHADRLQEAHRILHI